MAAAQPPGMILRADGMAAPESLTRGVVDERPGARSRLGDLQRPHVEVILAGSLHRAPVTSSASAPGFSMAVWLPSDLLWLVSYKLAATRHPWVRQRRLGYSSLTPRSGISSGVVPFILLISPPIFFLFLSSHGTKKGDW